MPQLIALPLLFLVVLQSLAGVSADPLLPHGLRGLQQSNITTSNTTGNTNNNNNDNLNIGPRFEAIDAQFQVETLDSAFYLSGNPPDPHGAAGKHSVIAVVNNHIEARNKNGGLLWRSTLRNFFRPAGDLAMGYDPKIIYDSHEQRFVVVYLDSDSSTYSSIVLAVSKNGNPKTWQTSDWYFNKIDSLTEIDGQDTWADYPGFEVDDKAVYITANMLTTTTPEKFVQSRLWIVDKGVNGGFYGGGTARVTAKLPIVTIDNRFLFTYQPAEIRASNPSGAGPGIGTYLVSYDDNGLQDPTDPTSERLSIVRVDDPLGVPLLVQSYVSLSDIEDTTVPVPFAPQRGIDVLIDTVYRRVMDAVWHNDELWCVFTILRDGKAKAFWVKLTTDVAQGQIAALVDKGSILGEDIATGTYTFFPSVAVNNRGIAVFGFSASAKSIYAGAYVTMRDDKNDPRGKVRASQVVREGVAPYLNYREDDDDPTRWGDYSGISVDPANENCFWVYNMYAAPLDCYPNTTGCWGTTWARLCFH